MTSAASRLLLCCLVVVIATVLPTVDAARYVPGLELITHPADKELHLEVNSLRSNSEVFPIDYYKHNIFCRPQTLKKVEGSLGEIIWGDRKYESLYRVQVLRNVSCMAVPDCDAETNTKHLRENANTLRKLIRRGYRGQFSLDNMPAYRNAHHADKVVACNDTATGKLWSRNLYSSQRGYPIGIPAACAGTEYVNNHLFFRIKYSALEEADESHQFMIGQLMVYPWSVKWPSAKEDVCVSDPKTLPRLTFADIQNNTVYWTYSVEWIEDPTITWWTRWDEYFASSTSGSSASSHWFQVTVTAVVILLLSTIVLAIISRALHLDLHRYNTGDAVELQEETGWKLIHADVFRPPDRAHLLAIMTGNGYQILAVAVFVLLIGIFGFLSPARRGSLPMAIIIFYIFMSFVGGYVCGSLLRYFNCRHWRHVFACGASFPGVMFFIYLVADFISMSKGSSFAIPFGWMFLLFALWLLVNVPLTVLGASFAFGQEPLSNPVRVGRLAREIPPQAFLNSPWYLLVVPPLFPLFTVSVEFHFVLDYIWEGQSYYAFGVLGLVVFLWMIVTVLVTILHLYYILCYENHRWWWYAFLIPGGCGVHMFAWTVLYFTKLSITSFASGLLYFVYMGAVSYVYGIAAGAIGLTAGIWFTRLIYSRIKVD